MQPYRTLVAVLILFLMVGLSVVVIHSSRQKIKPQPTQSTKSTSAPHQNTAYPQTPPQAKTIGSNKIGNDASSEAVALKTKFVGMWREVTPTSTKETLEFRVDGTFRQADSGLTEIYDVTHCLTKQECVDAHHWPQDTTGSWSIVK